MIEVDVDLVCTSVKKADVDLVNGGGALFFLLLGTKMYSAYFLPQSTGGKSSVWSQPNDEN